MVPDCDGERKHSEHLTFWLSVFSVDEIVALLSCHDYIVAWLQACWTHFFWPPLCLQQKERHFCPGCKLKHIFFPLDECSTNEL